MFRTLSPLLCLALAGCIYISGQDYRNRVDPDGDSYTLPEDCDDGDDAIYPGAPERCNGKDNDCDGNVDTSGVDGTWYADADGDGYGDANATTASCEETDGTVTDHTDCDDANPDTYPGAEEVCDGADNDCNGEVDESGGTTTWYVDADGDGYGDPATGTTPCDHQPAGAVQNDTDCDDTDASISPDGIEVCDGADNDCDGQIDEDDAADAATWYLDHDEDGYGDASKTLEACNQPAGYVSDDTDCDDSSAGTHPGADELCDGLDNDCDGQVDVDATDAPVWYADMDGDSYGDSGAMLSITSCTQPADASGNADDCDDSDATISPDAEEICDGTDNDCDGEVDESDAEGAPTWYADADADGYGDSSTATIACEAPTDDISVDGDCDDSNSSVNPGEVELCDGVDNNCDGSTDEGCPISLGDVDQIIAGEADGDALGDTLAVGDITEEAGTGYADLLIGAPANDDEGDANSGALFVILGALSLTGTPEGITSIADAEWFDVPDDDTKTGFPTALEVMGDTNGDKIGDVVAIHHSTYGYVVEGSATPDRSKALYSDADIIYSCSVGAPTELSGGGDWDGDGLQDFIGARDGGTDSEGLFGGQDPSEGTGRLDIRYFPYAITSIWSADVTGDGYDDVLAGSASDAVLVEGGDFSASAYSSVYLSEFVLESTVSTNVQVSSVGDLDGDYKAEVLLSDPYVDADGFKEAGRVYVVDGSGAADGGTVTLGAPVGDVLLKVDGNGYHEHFGTKLRPAADQDGDGTADLLVGAPAAESNAGAVYLFLDPWSKTSISADDADTTWIGAAAGDAAGTSMAFGVDINGDHKNDVIIGAPGAGGGAGAVYISAGR